MWDEDFISGVKRHEGYSPVPKWDYKQFSWGHGTKTNRGAGTISREQADADLRSELDQARASVRQRFPGLDPGREQALSSFTYNLGPAWMQGSGLAQALDKGDWSDATRRMLSYDKAGGQTLPGLQSRRVWEASYLGGNPAPQSPQPSPQAQSKLMADQGGGFFSWLNSPIGEANSRNAAIRDQYAGANGRLDDKADPSIEAMLAKRGFTGDEAKQLANVYALQRDLNAQALQRQPMTWGQGLGESLKVLGGVLHHTKGGGAEAARGMIDSSFANQREGDKLRQQLGLSSAIQNSQQLGTAVDNLLKEQRLRLEQQRRANANADVAGVARPYPNTPMADQFTGGSATQNLPGGPSVGGVSGGGQPPPAQGQDPAPASPQAQGGPPGSGNLARAKYFALQGKDGEGIAKIFQEQSNQETEAARKAAVATSEEQARAQGAAAARLPIVEHAADQLNKEIDEVLDPSRRGALHQVIGPFDNAFFNPTLRSSSRDMAGRLDQIQNRTFLQAFESLKGAGAITDREGEKATNALNRLSNRSVDEKDYIAAIKEFRHEVGELVKLAKKKAGAGVVPMGGAAPGISALPQSAPDAATANNDPLGLR